MQLPISKWYNARKKKADQKAFEEGYEWAAGKLVLTKGCGAEIIEAHILGQDSPFDRGASKALKDYDNLLTRYLANAVE